MTTEPAPDAGRPQLEELAARFTNGYKTIGEMVYDVIRESIVAGVFAPGERLRQEALASAIGVSRIPVRSALLQLETEGLVDFHPRRGAVVRSLTTAQLREVYELRELLEPYALEKSIALMSPQRAQELHQLAETLDREHDGPEFLELRIQFYRVLYDHERNPELVKIIEDLRSTVGRYLLGWRVAAEQEHSHKALVDAVVAGDVPAAKAHLLAHLEQVRTGLEQLVARAADEAPRAVPKS